MIRKRYPASTLFPTWSWKSLGAVWVSLILKVCSFVPHKANTSRKSNRINARKVAGRPRRGKHRYQTWYRNIPLSQHTSTVEGSARLALICVAAAGCSGCDSQSTVAPARPRQFAVAPTQSDVTYCSPGGVAQKMDIYAPPLSTPKPYTALMFIHGGQWLAGDKARGDVGPYDFGRFANKGFFVVSINYRTGSLQPPDSADIFPAYVEDAACAVRHIRANAALYQIQDSIGVWGHSAGGHIAGLLATADSGQYDTGEYPGFSSRVQAVATYAAPFDLTSIATDFEAVVASETQLIFSDSATRAAATVMNHVTTDDPPFLIVHGTLDESVFWAHPQKMVAALQSAGVPVTLLTVTNGGHYLTLPAKYKKQGLTASPTRLQISNTVAAFFDHHLR